jgi:putative hydrolase of the HAD superfamily
MDGGILSYHEFVTKPNPRIYQLLIEKYQLVPEECVFLDDMPCNIEAAKACGLGGIVFETKEQVERDLAVLGVTL